jgi:hypothetical protein
MLETINTAHFNLSELEPKSAPPVRAMLIEAGLNVSDWDIGKDNRVLDNPNTNSFKNAFWSFSDGKITVLCVWLREMSSDINGAYCDENMQQLINEEGHEITKASGARKTALRNRINKAGQFQRMAYDAYKNRRQIRVIVLGKDVGRDGDAEHAKSRMLDTIPWFVETFDGVSGYFRLRRGLIPDLHKLTEDQLAEASIFADVERVNSAIELSETEKEAIVKQRVGQGLFRVRLEDYWNSQCSLTKCNTRALLTASHIVPWSQCKTTSQRLEASNGLLLVAHVDRLFDAGYITFDENFKILINSKLSPVDSHILGLHPQMVLAKKPSNIIPSLIWHRKNVFDKRTQSDF